MANPGSPPKSQAKESLSFNNQVFINCPFDDDYKPIFYAIVFAIQDLGFIARCALEAVGTEQSRLDKIIEIIGECQYGVHDISRTELGQTNLPRFNMPFECGLFWGCLRFGGRKHKNKRILVLDREAYRYRSLLSDLAGQEIKSHNDSPSVAIDRVRTWLNAELKLQSQPQSEPRKLPGGKAIWSRYALFQRDLPRMVKVAGITRVELYQPEYYPDYVSFITNWLTLKEAAAK